MFRASPDRPQNNSNTYCPFSSVSKPDALHMHFRRVILTSKSILTTVFPNSFLFCSVLFFLFFSFLFHLFSFLFFSLLFWLSGQTWLAFTERKRAMRKENFYMHDHIRDIIHKYLQANTVRLLENLFLKNSDRFWYQVIKNFYKNDRYSNQSRNETQPAMVRLFS